VLFMVAGPSIDRLGMKRRLVSAATSASRRAQKQDFLERGQTRATLPALFTPASAASAHLGRRRVRASQLAPGARSRRQRALSRGGTVCGCSHGGPRRRRRLKRLLWHARVCPACSRGSSATWAAPDTLSRSCPKNATEEELKKAYRKLAMKWHPVRRDASATPLLPVSCGI
jgi:hypothetical protein